MSDYARGLNRWEEEGILENITRQKGEKYIGKDRKKATRKRGLGRTL